MSRYLCGDVVVESILAMRVFVVWTQTSGHWEERVNESGQLVYTNKVIDDAKNGAFVSVNRTECLCLALITAENRRDDGGETFNLWVCDCKGC
jgi:hypothetical protein